MRVGCKRESAAGENDIFSMKGGGRRERVSSDKNKNNNNNNNNNNNKKNEKKKPGISLVFLLLPGRGRIVVDASLFTIARPRGINGQVVGAVWLLPPPHEVLKRPSAAPAVGFRRVNFDCRPGAPADGVPSLNPVGVGGRGQDGTVVDEVRFDAEVDVGPRRGGAKGGGGVGRD